MISIFRSVICSVSLLVTTVNAATLDGSNVSAALYCCTAPTEPFRIATVASSTVGNGVEFPQNTFAFSVDGGKWDEGSIDVGNTSIHVDLFASGTTNAGTFNGFVFTFTGAPQIIGASVRAGSTFLPTSVVFNQSQVLIDVASRPYVASSFLDIDLTLAPVPEAGTTSLLAFGLAALVLWSHRPRSRQDA